MDDVHHHKNELTSIKNPSQFTIFLSIDLRIQGLMKGLQPTWNESKILNS